jgi:hypothetical protein
MLQQAEQMRDSNDPVCFLANDFSRIQVTAEHPGIDAFNLLVGFHGFLFLLECTACTGLNNLLSKT